MFEVKSHEVTDKHTGVTVAFGEYEADGKTCWMRITAPPYTDGGTPRVSTVFFDRGGEVRTIQVHPAPAVEARHADPAWDKVLQYDPVLNPVRDLEPDPVYPKPGQGVDPYLTPPLVDPATGRA
jgi:hypothetical protein